MTRREWLIRGFLTTTLGTAAAAMGGIFLEVWTAAGRFSAAHWTDLAPLGHFRAEGAVPFPSQRVAVVRRSGRLAALSLECTHLGCLVNALDQGFFCPCHGSEFGPLGELYSGPASAPLPWHPVLVRQGRLWVHMGKKLERPDWVTASGQEQEGN